MRIETKLRRHGVRLAALSVLVVTGIVIANATQTLTVPNAAIYSYNLAPGASSSPITPATNQAVFMLGVQLNVGYRGVASATILHIPGNFIEWVGLESPSGSAVTEGFGAAAGTHILYLDFSHKVDVQVAGPDTIQIYNGNTTAQSGNLKLIW